MSKKVLIVIIISILPLGKILSSLRLPLIAYSSTSLISQKAYADTAESLIRNGVKKVRERDYAGAYKNFNNAINSNPYEITIYRAYFWRGYLDFLINNNPEKGIKDMTKAINLREARGKIWGLAYDSRALAKLELGEIQSACKDFRKAASVGYKVDQKFYIVCN